MAHEINNPLAGMMQTANVMSNRLTNFEMPANLHAAEQAGTSMESIRRFMELRGINEMINTITESGQRVAEIIENMLSFSRKSEVEISSYDLAELLDKTLELAATDYDLRKQYDFKLIKIIKEYEPNLPFVPCERAKIQQVILNVLRNGAEAMQEVTEVEPQFTLRTRYDRNRQMVCMEIEDNGPGMDETTRRRVFEPFFTTKPVGIGTGLGLSVSYFIITEIHDGEIFVESQPGAGAKFVICLPLMRK
jgi:signal transduction histidine kinase